jgi:hypothetical protein
MRVKQADPRMQALGARLIIAGVLEELRADPESFARLLVGVAQVRHGDAVEVAKLLVAASEGPGSGVTDRAGVITGPELTR